VLLHDPTTRKGECPKLKQRWRGPYIIVAKSDDGLLYKLRHCETGKEQRSMIHSNRIKAYNEDIEVFYTRNQIQPSTQSQADSSQMDDWQEIKKVTSRKKISGKDTFLVHWKDGSKSREPAENITDFAKTQYHLVQNQRKRRVRRRV